MNFKTEVPTFNLLTIGQRGVGKTVFLAGSYAELHTPNPHAEKQPLWFDCQDRQVETNLDDILRYIVETGEYPPPTMRIAHFGFSLKRRQLWQTQTLSHFRWSDIPGEICTIENRDFRAFISNSHGCCVFIDAYALVHQPDYLQTIEDIAKQVTAIANLAHLHDFEYPFVIVLTKCDLLDSSRLQQQLKPALKPLTSRLDAVKANYRTFYSLIPIDGTAGTATLHPTGAAAPLLWLVWELSRPYHPSVLRHLHELVTRQWSYSFYSWQELVEGKSHRQVTEPNPEVKAKHQLNFFSLAANQRNLLVMALAFLALVGFIGIVSSQKQENNSSIEKTKITTP